MHTKADTKPRLTRHEELLRNASLGNDYRNGMATDYAPGISTFCFFLFILTLFCRNKYWGEEEETEMGEDMGRK